jgi:S-DNA-T family DNA segregation ATPase FtsK/SpoIIIE
MLGTPVLAAAPPLLGPSRGLSLPIGLADQPETQVQGTLGVGPADGHLAIVGAPRSGRTTAAVQVAAAALAGGLTVNVVTNRVGEWAGLRSHPGLGSVVPPDQAQALVQATGTAQGVLVVDGAEEQAETLWPGHSGSALEMMAKQDWWLVATAGARPSRWLSLFPQRLVLAVPDQGEDMALGVPRQLAGTRLNPGRACYLRPGTAMVCQVAQPGPGPEGGQGTPRAGAQATGPAPPRRLVPLPQTVTPSDLPPPSLDRLWCGLGGRLGLPVALDLAPGRPVAICGPAGAGAAGLLRALAHQAKRAGHVVHPFESDDPWTPAIRHLEQGGLVLAEDLEAAPPPPFRLPPTGVLLGALATPTAFTGTVFQTRPSGVVLWPHVPGAGLPFGLSLPRSTPQVAVPGRGLAVRNGQLTPIQAVTTT